MLNAATAVVITLWVGSLWTIGYVVAPVLFALLADRALAGGIAGDLFSVETWISLVCGLLVIAAQLSRRRRWRSPGVVLPALMMAALAASEYLVRPAMSAARLALGADAERFALLHGVSAALYLVASLLGVALVVWWATARRDDHTAAP